MRLCYLADATSVHAQKWISYFASRGHQVHLISREEPDNNSLSNVTLHIVKPVETIRGVSLLMFVRQVRKVLKSITPDITHAHYASTYGFWSALAMFHPSVLTAWGSDILITPRISKLSMLKVRFALRQADLITCDAQHLAKKMTELGASEQKIALVCFGVDTRKFAADKRDPDLRSRLELHEDALLVISLRRLTEVYDVEALVRAAPMVLARVPEARFVIAGCGDQRTYLESLAELLGVAHGVRFVGMISNDDLPRYLASADVYVSTSLSDAGIAASTAEAMACQLPVIVTDVAENRDWVRDGEGGFVIPPRDPEALADRIIRLLRDESARRTFGAVNRRIVQERNEYSTQMEKVEHMYREVIRRHSGLGQR
ncbi:MAG: glycosyltransferase family 4 protein [Candidatus Bathyarchaeia archaeon]|jgi:glycosyltransferase involved in cell wall biosynthesis